MGSVEEMKRREAYERSQQLKRIQGETERSRALLEERRQLQDQRRLANMQASLQRQQIVQVGRWGGVVGVQLCARVTTTCTHHPNLSVPAVWILPSFPPASPSS